MAIPLLVILLTQIPNPVLKESMLIKPTHYLRSQLPFLKSRRKTSVSMYRLKLTGSPCKHAKSILAMHF